MRLENHNLLWLFSFVLGVLGVLLLQTKLKFARLRRFADSSLFSQIIPRFDRYHLFLRRNIVISCAITFFLVLALLRPQWGFHWKESVRKGADIAIAVDVSDSMLARDVSPSRIERARREIEDLIDILKGDRVSLIAFSGVAFIETPLTLDYGALKLFLQSINPELIPIKGTNIESAITKGIEALTGKALDDANQEPLAHRGRAIVLLTDGEDFGGNLEKASARAAELGIRIYIIGIGTADGAPIPYSGGLKKDSKGNVVISRLNEPQLRELANKTRGTYVSSISNLSSLTTVYEKSIREDLELSLIAGDKAKRWNEFFQIPLLLAFLCLVFGTDWLREKPFLFRLEGESSIIASETPGRISVQILIPFLVTLITFMTSHSSAFADTPVDSKVAESLRKGKELLTRGDFKGAEKTFNETLSSNKENPNALFGLGESFYRQKKYLEAANAFVSAASKSADKAFEAEALYNLGNSLLQHGSVEDAVNAYEESLKLSPADQETKDNLAYAKKLLEKQKDNKQDEQKENKQQNNDQQQDQKNKDETSSKNHNESQSDNQEDKSQNEQKSGSDNSSSTSDTSQEQNQDDTNSKDEQQNKQQEGNLKNDAQDKGGSQEKESDRENQQSDESEDKGKSAMDISSSSSSGNANDTTSPLNNINKNSDEKEREGQSSASDEAATLKTSPSPNDSPETRSPNEEDLTGVLGYITENRDKYETFRKEKAFSELEAHQQEEPEKDW